MTSCDKVPDFINFVDQMAKTTDLNHLKLSFTELLTALQNKTVDVKSFLESALVGNERSAAGRMMRDQLTVSTMALSN